MSRVLQCLLPITLLLAGCAVLYSDAPLGEPATFTPSDWDGLWVCSGADWGLPARRPLRGRTEIPGSKNPGYTEKWRECDANLAGPWRDFPFVNHYDELLLPACNGRLNTGEPCEAEAAALRAGEQLVFFNLNGARIRELVVEGKVPGRVEILPPEEMLSSEARKQRHIVVQAPSADSLAVGYERERVVLHSLTDNHYRILFDIRGGVLRQIPFAACIRLPRELDPCSRPD